MQFSTVHRVFVGHVIGGVKLDFVQRCGYISLFQYFSMSGPETTLKKCPKLKPRWDVHSRDDEDWLGCASEALASVLGG